MNYLTEEELKMNRKLVNLQIALGLQTCKTKGEVSRLLDDIREHERRQMIKLISGKEEFVSLSLLKEKLELIEYNYQFFGLTQVLLKEVGFEQPDNDLVFSDPAINKALAKIDRKKVHLK